MPAGSNVKIKALFGRTQIWASKSSEFKSHPVVRMIINYMKKSLTPCVGRNRIRER
jgi:hypothetical protein